MLQVTQIDTDRQTDRQTVRHTHTHTHTCSDSSGRVIGPSQRAPPDNTQHLKETDSFAVGGIRARSNSTRAAADPRLRPRGYWDRLQP
jgi:hypothetical protein